MFALLRSKRMQLKKRLCDIYTVLNLECVEVRENEMQLRKSSGSTAQLRTLEGTLSGREIVVSANLCCHKSRGKLQQRSIAGHSF